MMKRDECFRVLARHVTDEVIVSTYSSAVDWLNLGERTLNYFSVGAMGLDSSHALGLALGRPGKRIICLQGDGSLLMNLGCLVTTAAAAPKNLVHIVVQNGTYEANGGHPIPNTEVDFAAMARAAGYAHVHDFSQLANFEQQAAPRPQAGGAGVRDAARGAVEAAHLRLSEPVRSGAAQGAQGCAAVATVGWAKAPNRSFAMRALERAFAHARFYRAQLATAVAASGTTRRYPTPSSVSRIRGWVGSTSIFCRSLRTKMRR